MADFTEATAVRQLTPARYAVDIDPSWSVGTVPNGGYLLALLLRAITDASDHPHPVATSAHFLEPPVAGPAEIHLHTMRSGKTTTVVRASLVQNDQSTVESIVTCARLERDARVEWSGPPAEEIAPVDECIPGQVDLPDGTKVGLLEHVDLRLDPATIGWFSGHPAGSLAMRGHFRLADGTQPDPIVLSLAVDALPPTVFGLGRLGWAPTVELSVFTRGLPAAGWLQVHLRGRLVRDRWFDEEAEVYDATGALVAQSRQLARIRVH